MNEGDTEKKLKALIVDDEPTIREYLAELLAGEGYQCATAADGAMALDLLEQAAFDAVITDIMMPGIDGIALTKEITSRYGPLPVMIITGYPDRYTTNEALDAGASEFIVKPFSQIEFLVRFQKMVNDYSRLHQLLAKKKELALKSTRTIGMIEKSHEAEVQHLNAEIEQLKSLLDQRRASTLG